MKKLAIVLSLAVLLAACKEREQTVDAAKPRKTKAAATTTGTDVGSRMPDYSASWLDGSKFEMASTRDKVVLLNVWATWCGPCRYEIPELQAIHQKYSAKGFEVVGVSVDESGVEAVKQFVAEQKMTYPVVLDPAGTITSIFEISVLPTSVLVDREGRIVWKRPGLITPNDQELAAAIEKAL